MITVIGFDADDTLWVNEPNYLETEKEFCRMLSAWKPAEETSALLFSTEMANLELYGYGAKSFILSMIETAVSVSAGQVGALTISEITRLGKSLINKDVELLDGVEETLQQLSAGYRLILATKGDLADQERKLGKSGLEKYFHHIEIMRDKKDDNYRRLLNHLDIPAADFLMVGNSLKSDIIPVLNLGGHAIHIPYHTTWQHEKTDDLPVYPFFTELRTIKQLPQFIATYESNH
ncbi:MAG: HAD family hydrolase [Bacteroidales bacterium]|nr:HAD family hydrolase [Bacteroidales bacterium]